MGVVATALAYVRTEDGVVQVAPGEGVPAGANEAHVEALTKAGVFAAAEVTADAQVAGDEPAKPKGRRG